MRLLYAMLRLGKLPRFRASGVLDYDSISSSSSSSMVYVVSTRNSCHASHLGYRCSETHE